MIALRALDAGSGAGRGAIESSVGRAPRHRRAVVTVRNAEKVGWSVPWALVE